MHRDWHEDLKAAKCTVEGCARPHKSLLYCEMHYQRAQRNGGPIVKMTPQGAPARRDDLGRKLCRTCQKWLDVAEFGKNGRTSDGLTGDCMPCSRILGRSRARVGGSRLLATSRDEHGNKYCKDCKHWLPEASFGINRRVVDGLSNNCSNCRSAKSRSNSLMRYYRMTTEQFEAMFSAQGGRCASCRDEFTTKPHIDHDHACCPTEKSCGDCVRGLLCNRCNLGMGIFLDEPRRLMAAANYLIDAN